MNLRLTSKFKKLNQYLAVYYLSGKNVYCQLCGWQGSSFFENSRCPKCSSLPRTRLLPFSYEYFKLNQESVRYVMHVGPNYAEQLWERRNNIGSPLIRVDLSFRQNMIDLQMDICHIATEANQLDLIICWHVLEHVPEDNSAIQEFYRVLKPGGSALISVPIHPPGRRNTFEDKNIPAQDYLKVYGHPDHVRACGLDYYKRFEDVGFLVKELKVDQLIKNGSKDEINFHGLSEEHVVWCCTK